MPEYHALFSLTPSGIFGLPDGEFVVVPGGPDPIKSPVLDTRTGVLVSHGTLSRYRDEASMHRVSVSINDVSVRTEDNFATVVVNASTAEEAFAEAARIIDVFTQGLGAQLGEVVTGSLQSFTNAEGVTMLQRQHVPVQLMKLRAYNLEQLKEKVTTAAVWATSADTRAQKALYYFESALLFRNFANGLQLGTAHTAFAHALAFLQLFKAVVTIIGEPAVDRDYQSRARRLGLPADFWETDVKRFYLVRSDADVAHHSLETPDAAELQKQFVGALEVFRVVLTAHMSRAGA